METDREGSKDRVWTATNRRTLLVRRARRLGSDGGVGARSEEAKGVVPLVHDGHGLGGREREESKGDDGSDVHI